MDPVSIILAALTAGAAAAAKETAGTAIKEAYEGLKGLLKKKLAGKAMATAVLDAHHEDPKAADAVLRPALKDAGADADAALMEAARAILAKADPEGKIAVRYQLNVSGDVHGSVQGDHAKVNMTFGTLKPRRE
jgi:hypothetical protein